MSTNLKQLSNTAASEMFQDCVCDSGSLVVECACGRVHFATDAGAGDYDEGELSKLLANAKKNPEKYLENQVCSSISTGKLDGYTVVYNCPCNWGARHEHFIWANRELIAKYLELRTNEELKTALNNKATAKLIYGSNEELSIHERWLAALANENNIIIGKTLYSKQQSDSRARGALVLLNDAKLVRVTLQREGDVPIYLIGRKDVPIKATRGKFVDEEKMQALGIKPEQHPQFAGEISNEAEF